MNKVISKGTFTTKNIAIIGLLGALTAVLGLTPLGFIPIGPTRATIMHIPVIVGGILYGPMVGGFVGLIFGIFSFINAFINMTPVSFVFFNPIISVLPRILIGIGSSYIYRLVKNLGGEKFKWLLTLVFLAISVYLSFGIYTALNSKDWFLFLANLILLMITLGLSYYILKRYPYDSLEIVAAAIGGSLINTIGVLSLIYFIYGERFVQALGQNVEFSRKIIFGIGLVNGIPEAIIAVILVTSVINAYKKRK